MEQADKFLVELNLSNYNDEDVREAQNGMLQCSQILTRLLALRDTKEARHDSPANDKGENKP